MRTPLIAANWKMHKTTGETRDFITEFIPLVKDVADVEVVIAPPFTSLAVAAKFLKGTSIKLSGQDVYWEEKGAFTGEISPPMLRDVGCTYVLVGHSERRRYFGETDETANRKIKAAKAVGLDVIFCIGETLEERESGRTFEVLKRQIAGGLAGVDPSGIVVAYEPVWAIGTGKTATPEQAQEAHRFIRDEFRNLFGDSSADRVRILYGGSVKPENISELMSKDDVDGGLVGGAGLEADSFSNIVKFKKQTM
ncbi:bifunctional PGK/TIM [bacterium BMS3Bbin06]|nr:bifunctional PGK/TIM [bacterium BMS3Bbin06]